MALSGTDLGACGSHLRKEGKSAREKENDGWWRHEAEDGGTCLAWMSELPMRKNTLN
jgi:hypothetical protein